MWEQLQLPAWQSPRVLGQVQHSPAGPVEPLGLLWALCPGRVQVELSPALEGEPEALGLLRSFASPLAWGSAKVKIDFCSKCEIA